MSEALLEGLVVLDMSQFLSGPFAALRLADLGARVIKIERPDGGDRRRGSPGGGLARFHRRESTPPDKR